mmetsp:Transcript_32388/g.81750  ORF Transcript_32388/g.81750 Transcript_32388/m.81750 type:complete len:499 (+) Transcript_32388:1230-2726(+)
MRKVLQVLQQLPPRKVGEAASQHDVAEALQRDGACGAVGALRELRHQVLHQSHRNVDVAVPQRVADLVRGHVAVAVLVQEVEDVMQRLRREDRAAVDRGGDELLVADRPLLPHVQRVHQVVHLRVVHAQPSYLQALLQLIQRDLPVLVQVQSLKRLLQVGDALRHKAVGGNVEHQPLQPCCFGEIVQSLHHEAVQQVALVASHPNPGVLERLSGGQPGAIIAVQKFGHEVLAHGRDAVPGGRLEVDGGVDDGLEDVAVGLAPEGRRPRQQDVDDDARTPHVHVLAVAALEHFRRHIVRAAHHLVHLLLHAALAGHKGGEPEVDGAQVVGWKGRPLPHLLLQKKVLRLEVAVNNPVLVAELDDLQDDARDVRRLALGELPPLDDRVEQLPAAADLHDEEHLRAVLPHLAQPYHILMLRQQLHDGHLVHKVVPLEVGPELGDGLTGPDLAGDGVGDEVGGAIVPLAKLLPETVPDAWIPVVPRHAPDLPPLQPATAAVAA